MAGQAVLSAFMQALLEKLITAAADEVKLLLGVKGELQSMASTLSMIQSILEDAEEKQLNDKSVRLWLQELKDVAYDMDELLDRHLTQVSRRRGRKLQINGSHKARGWMQVSHWLITRSPIYNISYDYKLAKEVRKLHERLDKIARERVNLGLQMVGDTSQLPFTEPPQSSSLVDDKNLYGRDKDREAIIGMLLFPKNSRDNVSVLPIVGMGGLGKTTLAQLVYNDHKVKEHFELRIWVSAENFDEIKLTKETLESVISEYSSITTTNMNLLQEDLVEQLKGKCFLLVLDDVWNQDPYKWQRYRKAFAAAGKGSMVIITTRNSNTGRLMNALPPYQLECLSDDDCWRLFESYAFVDGNSSEYPNLQRIGKKLVKKLKGLPLAAKALAVLLYSKIDEEDWMSILKSEIWQLPENETNILPALRLSYKHLPRHLKQCFVFCSVFHKDYIFKKDKLVKIWLALGFIQPQGTKRLEDIGRSYFDELVSRSFFQTHKLNYVMHDTIHDLAQSLAFGECHKLDDNKEFDDDDLRDIDQNHVRHLSFSCATSSSNQFQRFYPFKNLRTLLLLRGYKSTISSIPNDLFMVMQCLRVLDLNRRDIHELPESIGNLIHLRYLGLSDTDIKCLPNSISKLHNLQTLSLEHCNELTEIPDSITRLVNLRHLEANNLLISEISRIGSLTSLQELDEFIVRKDKGHKIAELKGMKELKGHLRVKGLENVRNRKEAKEATMKSKIFLNVLDLEWNDERNVSIKDGHEDYEILEALQPHHELKELKIKGYAGAMFPSWLGNSSFCYLQAIHISNCRQFDHFPHLELLPSLRYLTVAEVHGLTRINCTSSGKGDTKIFPSLTELFFEDMPYLEEWNCTNDDELFPCLNELDIVACPKLKALPRLPPKLVRLKISESGIIALPELHSSNTSFLSLHIQQCQNLKSLEQGFLNKELDVLEALTIIDCEGLVSLPVGGFQNLVALKSLHMYKCPNIVLPDADKILLPRSIEDLRITSCSKMAIQLINETKDLPVLKYLQITGCSELYYFPEDWLPAKLEFFGVVDCNNLQHLPPTLQELSCLDILIVRNCPRIKCLPEKGLPAKLHEFWATGCLNLKERSEEISGEDWHKIKKIPKIVIH